MKNFKLTYIFISILISALFANFGRVQYIEGSTRVIRAGSGEKESLYRYQKIYDGDKVVTSKRAYVEIVLRDNTLLRVAPNSEFTVRISNGKRQIGLTKGKLWSAINKIKKNEQMNFVTSTIVAAIRGTRIRLEASQGGSRLVVEEGKVLVSDKNRRKSMMLGENKEIAGGIDGLGGIEAYSQDKEKRWEKFTTKAYLREMKNAKNKLIQFYDLANNYDFSTIEKINSELASLKDKDTVISKINILKIVYTDFINLENKIKETIRKVKNIYQSRDLDPDKGDFQDLYEQIEDLIDSKLDSTSKMIAGKKKEVETLISRLQNLKFDDSANDKKTDETSDKDINKKINQIFNNESKLEIIDEEVNFLIKKLDSRSGLGVEEIKEINNQLEASREKIVEIQKQSEYSYKRILKKLKDSLDLREEMKEKVKLLGSTLVNIVEKSNKLLSVINRMMMFNKKDISSKESSEDSKSNEEQKGKLLELEEEIKDLSTKISEDLTDLDSFFRYLGEYKALLNNYYRIAKSLNDEVSLNNYRNYLSEYQYFKLYFDTNIKKDKDSEQELEEFEEKDSIGFDIKNKIRSIEKGINTLLKNISTSIENLDYAQDLILNNKEGFEKANEYIEEETKNFLKYKNTLRNLENQYMRIKLSLQDIDDDETKDRLDNIEDKLELIKELLNHDLSKYEGINKNLNNNILIELDRNHLRKINILFKNISTSIENLDNLQDLILEDEEDFTEANEYIEEEERNFLRYKNTFYNLENEYINVKASLKDVNDEEVQNKLNEIDNKLESVRELLSQDLFRYKDMIKSKYNNLNKGMNDGILKEINKYYKEINSSKVSIINLIKTENSQIEKMLEELTELEENLLDEQGKLEKDNQVYDIMKSSLNTFSEMKEVRQVLESKSEYFVELHNYNQMLVIFDALERNGKLNTRESYLIDTYAKKTISLVISPVEDKQASFDEILERRKDYQSQLTSIKTKRKALDNKKNNNNYKLISDKIEELLEKIQDYYDYVDNKKDMISKMQPNQRQQYLRIDKLIANYKTEIEEYIDEISSKVTEPLGSDYDDSNQEITNFKTLLGKLNDRDIQNSIDKTEEIIEDMKAIRQILHL